MECVPVVSSDVHEVGRLSGLADRIALFLSVVLSPFVVAPTFCVLLVWSSVDTWYEFFRWLSVCVFFSTAVPCGYIIYQVHCGRITDLHVKLLEQRTGPFVAGTIGLGVLALVLKLFGAPAVLFHMALVTFINGVVFALISRRWKISVHTGVLGCCLGGGRELLGWSGVWFWLLQPPLVWARARRGRHHPVQGGVGAVLGYVLTRLGLSMLSSGGV